MGWVDRTKRENYNALEINQVVKKGELSKIVDMAFNNLGTTETSKMLDKIKATGFKYSTLGCMTINVYDMQVPNQKDEIIEEANKRFWKTINSLQED